jgi:hypothetical protein
MSTLAELQSGFQSGVLNSDPEILDHLRGSSRQTRDALFDVYRLGYAGRLVEVLESEYEVLALWLGGDFASMGRAYVEAHPSDVRNARYFGRHLPDFLADRIIDAPTAVTAEIAALELALSDAFDAEDAATLSLDDLAALEPEDWPRLTLAPHPSARILTFQANAADIWEALRKDLEIPEPARLAEPSRFIVWRQDFTARFRLMRDEESMMWNEAAKGLAFGALCEMVSTFGGADGAELRAASYLKGWIDAGMLARA